MALISYRKNSYTRGWYIKFLNLSIIEYRINFEKQKGIFHVFGLPLFFTNVKVKTVEKYADAVFRFFPIMTSMFAAIPGQVKFTSWHYDCKNTSMIRARRILASSAPIRS